MALYIILVTVPIIRVFSKNTHKRKFKTRKRIFSWAYSKACNRKMNWSNPIWPHWGKDTSTPLEVSNGNSRRGSVAPPPSGHRPTGRRWHCRAWSMHRKVGGALEKEPAVSWNMLFPRGHMNKWTCMSKNMPYFIPLYIYNQGWQVYLERGAYFGCSGGPLSFLRCLTEAANCLPYPIGYCLRLAKYWGEIKRIKRIKSLRLKID